MAIEKLIYILDGKLAKMWDNCHRVMEQAGGLDVMLKLQSELKTVGHGYAVVLEDRPSGNIFADTLRLRWDLKTTQDRWLSRGIKLEADEKGKVGVFYTVAPYGWENLKYNHQYVKQSQEKGEMSLEEKARLAMTLAGYHPDRFHANRWENVLQRVINSIETKKVA